MADFDSDIAGFEEKVNKYVKQLSSKKASERREAVQWLGESGEPHVIEPLVKLYEKEKDASVKEAITYSLGMFRALEQALDRGEENKVLALLKKVTSEGKMGKRLPVPTRVMTLIMVGLVILLVALGAGVFATGGLPFGGDDVEIIDETEVANVDSSAARSLLEITPDVSFTLGRVRDDTNTLQAQYQAAVDGTFGDANCGAFFNNLPVFTLADAENAAYPALGELVNRLKTSQENLASAKAAYDEACLAGTPTMTTDQASTPLQTIANIQSELTDIELDLSELQASAMVTPTVATEEPAPTEVVEDTAVPTPTVIPGADPLVHVSPLTSLIEDMTTLRGPAVILEQYWTDVQNAGRTDGCRQVDPEIPEDYTIPPEAAAASANLQSAVDAVNLGLQVLRDGWREFRAACDNNTLSSNLARGQSTVETINTAFNGARNLLNTVRSGG